MARNGKTKTPIDMAMLERIHILMVQCHVANTTRMAKETGIAQATLNKKVRGDEAFNYDQLMKILETYPDVSADWLLLGKGEIFRSGRKEDAETLRDLEAENTSLKEKISQQCEQILSLNDELTKKNRQIDVLLDEKVRNYNNNN